MSQIGIGAPVLPVLRPSGEYEKGQDFAVGQKKAQEVSALPVDDVNVIDIHNRAVRPIGGFQMVQEMIADMIAETDAARFLTYRAWQLIDQGKRARMESALAKGYACEAAVRVAAKAVKIHGGMGIDERHPIERYLRDARALTIPDGTTQIQKLIVGREAIGIKAFQ